MYFNPGQWLFRKTHGSRTAETLRLDPAGSVQALAQRVHQIAAGYEDCNDCDDLRDDMIFKLCAGRAPQTGDSLA